MKTSQVVPLFMLAGVVIVGLAGRSLHAEDKYIRNVPLDAFTVPVPPVPQGSTLDLRPTRTPDAGDRMRGYTPGGGEGTTPSIGLSIKAPVGDGK
jgi:hypothetical protein